MKFIIVLFAVVVAASAYPGIYHAPVVAAPAWPSAGWQPSGWQQPSYVKVAKVHAAPAVHHVSYVQQQPPIPPVHPQPLNIKVAAHSVRIPYAEVKPAYPHLIGYEAQVPEPQIKIVKAAPVAHHPWA